MTEKEIAEFIKLLEAEKQMLGELIVLERLKLIADEEKQEEVIE